MLKNMMDKRKKDYISMWFDVRTEQGISDAMSIGCLNKETTNINWRCFPHSKMDGLAGVASMLREYGYPCKNLPIGRDSSEPSFISLLLDSNKNHIDNYPKKITWKRNYLCGNSNVAPVVTCAFTKDQTVAIKKLARRNKVALSTYVLWALNRSISENLLISGQHYFWFYPVNLRGAINNDNEISNFSSGVNVCASNLIAPRELQINIRNKLKSKEYWMTWKLAHIGRFVGKAGVRKIYENLSKKNFYAGSFSFLGAWPLEDENNPIENPEEVWVSCGIGTKNYPVSTGVMEWYGQLTLGLKLHPWIAQDEKMTNACLLDWKKILLAEKVVK